jgi:hypothetical protein
MIEITKKKSRWLLFAGLLGALVFLATIASIVWDLNIPNEGRTTFSSVGVWNDKVVFSDVDLPRIFFGRFHGSLALMKNNLQFTYSNKDTCPLSAEFTINKNGERHVLITVGPDEFATRLKYFLRDSKVKIFTIECINGSPHIISSDSKADQKLW